MTIQLEFHMEESKLMFKNSVCALCGAYELSASVEELCASCVVAENGGVSDNKAFEKLKLILQQSSQSVFYLFIV